MKIDNQTRWRTSDLRRLIAAACRIDGIGTAGMRVRIVHARQRRGCSGYAWYHSRDMVLRVPPPDDGEDAMSNDIRDNLARVALHELAHCRGVRHADMDRDLRWTTQDLPVPWTQEISIRPVEKKASPAPRNIVAERAAHAAAMLARAERRLKLAKRLERKWRTKVKYYERKAAAGGLVTKPRLPRPPKPKSTIPTVAEIRRALGNGAKEIEVGMRDGTFDERHWSPESDLQDLYPLKALLAQLRSESSPSVVADLYVYGDENLIGNATLTVDGPVWSASW